MLRYNFIDLYSAASTFYDTKQIGVYTLFRHLYNRRWDMFFKKGRHNILDSTRWLNYIINPEKIIHSNLSVNDKAIIIKLASYRDLANLEIYGDKSINIERVDDDTLNRIKDIPLIKIENNKIKLTFED